jgi:hypothetical protein
MHGSMATLARSLEDLETSPQTKILKFRKNS